MDTVETAGLQIGDGHPTRVMGVVNVSAESPYGPSVFENAGAAARHIDEVLIDDGADIVDVGLASANKRFDVLSADAELERLDTACEAIDSVSGDAVFSIETRYHEVADAALRRGFEMVNDVCGFADPAMPDVCADYDVAVVKMASPPDLERPGALTSVDEIYEALQREGFTRKTILDPAFGGWSETKTLADDREIFRRLREFRALDRPILVSINRKNFLRALADRSTEAALPVSLAATSMAIERGVHVVRTHDVRETCDAAVVGDTFARERVQDREIGLEELVVDTTADLARHLDRFDASNAAPGDALGRAFVLDSLPPAARTNLVESAVGRDILCVTDGQRVLLGGTATNLRALADEIADPEPLSRALSRVRAACR